MKMIVGLGNIGKEFDGTPHNVGFSCIDRLAEEYGLDFKKKMKNGLVLREEIEGEEVLLVKPLTFMNNSGDCVQALCKKFSIKPTSVCVICDDVDLPISTVRIRPSGSAGTHNGLKSIVARLNSTDFVRIKIGVDVPEREQDLATFVLKKMSRENLEKLDEGVSKAMEFALNFIKGEVKGDTK